MANFVHFKRFMTYLHGHKLQSACYSMPLLFKICTTIFIREGLKFFKICCNLEGKGKIAKKLHSPKKIDLLNSTLCINLIFDFSMFFVVKNYSSDYLFYQSCANRKSRRKSKHISEASCVLFLHDLYNCGPQFKYISGGDCMKVYPGVKLSKYTYTLIHFNTLEIFFSFSAKI